jgi:hypothetical protein
MLPASGEDHGRFELEEPRAPRVVPLGMPRARPVVGRPVGWTYRTIGFHLADAIARCGDLLSP